MATRNTEYNGMRAITLAIISAALVLPSQMGACGTGIPAGPVDGQSTSGAITSVSGASGLTGGGSSGDLTLSIAAGGVQTNHLADGAVNSAKILDGSIAASDLAPGSVSTNAIADSAVTTAKLAAACVTNSKIGTGAVSVDKIDATNTTDGQVLLAINGQAEWNDGQWKPGQGGSIYNTNFAFVGIGTTTPSEPLQVAGNICATGTIGACSDVRFKDHIEPVVDALDMVERLEGVTFDWKRDEFCDHNFAEGPQIGFIAQEVEKVLPQVVHTGRDGYLSVDYGRLTPVIVEAIKQVRTEKDEQLAKRDSEIAELRAMNKEMNERLHQLEKSMQMFASVKSNGAR